MRKIKHHLISIFLTTGIFSVITPAFAQNKIMDKVNKVAGGFWNPIESGTGRQKVATAIGMVVKMLLSLVGVIFLILIIYAGFRWMFARGNEDEVAKAQKIIISSFQGLLIVLVAYALTTFVGYLVNEFNVLQ